MEEGDQIAVSILQPGGTESCPDRCFDPRISTRAGGRGKARRNTSFGGFITPRHAAGVEHVHVREARPRLQVGLADTDAPINQVGGGHIAGSSAPHDPTSSAAHCRAQSGQPIGRPGGRGSGRRLFDQPGLADLVGDLRVTDDSSYWPPAISDLLPRSAGKPKACRARRCGRPRAIASALSPPSSPPGSWKFRPAATKRSRPSEVGVGSGRSRMISGPRTASSTIVRRDRGSAIRNRECP